MGEARMVLVFGDQQPTQFRCDHLIWNGLGRGRLVTNCR